MDYNGFGRFFSRVIGDSVFDRLKKARMVVKSPIFYVSTGINSDMQIRDPSWLTGAERETNIIEQLLIIGIKASQISFDLSGNPMVNRKTLKMGDGWCIPDMGVLFKNLNDPAIGIMFEVLGYTLIKFGCENYAMKKDIQCMLNLMAGITQIYTSGYANIDEFYRNLRPSITKSESAKLGSIIQFRVKNIGKIAPLLTKEQSILLLHSLGFAGMESFQTGENPPTFFDFMVGLGDNYAKYGFSSRSEAENIQTAFGLVFDSNGNVGIRADNLKLFPDGMNMVKWWETILSSRVSTTNLMAKILKFNM